MAVTLGCLGCMWQDNRPLGFCCRARQKWLEFMACLIHSPVVQVEKYCNYNCHLQSVWEFFIRFKEKIANVRSQCSSRENLQENEYPKSQGEYIILLVGSSVGLWFVLRDIYLLLRCIFKEAVGKMENDNIGFELFYWGLWHDMAAEKSVHQCLLNWHTLDLFFAALCPKPEL